MSDPMMKTIDDAIAKIGQLRAQLAKAKTALRLSQGSAIRLQHSVDSLREEIERLRWALERISMMHDGNPPMPLADMPELDYARRTLGNMRAEARDALKQEIGQ